jgi:hypothetical protein
VELDPVLEVELDDESDELEFVVVTEVVEDPDDMSVELIVSVDVVEAWVGSVDWLEASASMPPGRAHAGITRRRVMWTGNVLRMKLSSSEVYADAARRCLDRAAADSSSDSEIARS